MRPCRPSWPGSELLKCNPGGTRSATGDSEPVSWAALSGGCSAGLPGPARGHPASALRPSVFAVAEREVGVVRVEAGVLKAVGVEPRIQSDPAALLAQAEQEPPDLRPAVVRLAPEDVAGEALAVDPDQLGGPPDPQTPPPTARPRARCSPAAGEPFEGVDPRGRAESVANRSGSMTWVRIVAVGRCIVLCFSPGRNGSRARSAGVRRCRTGAPPPAPHGGLGSTESFHRRRTAAPGSRPRRKAPRPGAVRPQGRS